MPAPGPSGATTRTPQSKPEPRPPHLFSDELHDMKTVKERLFILSQYLLPHHLLSRLIGHAAECRAPWFKDRLIGWFARQYQVNMAEAQVEDLDAYAHFNAFFTRALKDGARPLDTTPGAVLSPADGAISQLGPIEHGRVFQAKGHSFSVLELLGGDTERAAAFMGGDFATIYLSPKDYHRVQDRKSTRLNSSH